MDTMYYFLAADLILVFLVSWVINKQLHLKNWQLIAFTLIVVPVGLFCAKLMRLVEAGTWTGASLYGAVLFEPAIMILIGLLLKIKPVQMFDLGAPAGCVSIVFLKLQCKITGCCYGKILRYLPNGRPVRFPSQIVEMICGSILLIVLLVLARSGKQKGYLYAWFLLLYGSSRFVLNLFRDASPFILGMPQGCFWSIISVVIGGTVLLLRHKGILPRQAK